MVSVGHRIAYKNTLNLGFINGLFPGENLKRFNTGLTYIQKLMKKQDQNVKKFLFKEGTIRRFRPTVL